MIFSTFCSDPQVIFNVIIVVTLQEWFSFMAVIWEHWSWCLNSVPVVGSVGYTYVVSSAV
jgi:hypothetical protein